jgi:hypothetical protein
MRPAGNPVGCMSPESSLTNRYRQMPGRACHCLNIA